MINLLRVVQFVAIHLVYLGVAIWLYRRVRRISATLPSGQSRLIQTCVAAALFTPGLYWYFAFAMPTFALLTPLWHIIQFIDEGGRLKVPLNEWIVPQLAVTIVPFLITWTVLFQFGTFKDTRRDHP